MQRDEFDAWAERHSATFGLSGEVDLRMLDAWFEVFCAAGYTAAELAEATTWMASTKPPRFRSDHLPALTARIIERRAVVYRHEADAWERDRGTCTQCGGSARVVVPALPAVRDGRWCPLTPAANRCRPRYYTQAVLCSCALGSWFASRIRDSERCPMRLEQYQARNPRWRQQMAERHQEALVRASLVEASPKWAKSVRRILEQHGVRIPGCDEE